jgi:glyoxylase-like metal-dependent hydrolase (beta-lactamase superfamily II)
MNSPVNSNCYILHSNSSNDALLIDPGSADVSAILEYLETNKLNAVYIFLTHEHFDHIWGADQIRQLFGSKIIATEICSEAITNPKKNLSLFYDQVGFSSCGSDIGISDDVFKTEWNGYNVTCFKTPGHTPGSMCILIYGKLFTGDTLLRNANAVTKLPGGNAKSLKNSVDTILALRDEVAVIYPGHGDLFTHSELKQKFKL